MESDQLLGVGYAAILEVPLATMVGKEYLAVPDVAT
jgi:hypothetical protein